jgi:hypothetical protein
MNLSPSEHITNFFDSYRGAFERRDADRIVDHFAHPCHVTSDADGVQLAVTSGRDEWLGQIQRLIAAYDAIGMRSAEILRVTSTELARRVVQTLVDWRLRDASGAELYDFHVLYTLAEVDGRLRSVAIAHDEIPRLQELMITRGIQGPPSDRR